MKSNNRTFAVIGGDLRNYYLAKALQNHGYKVRLVGFDKLKVNSEDILFSLESDIIILPVIPFEKGTLLNAPFSDRVIDLEPVKDRLKGKRIFVGKVNNLLDRFPQLKNEVTSYSDREDFAVKNAVPTAEGAIEQAMINYDSTINGSKILICGYGRIGKVLSEMLHGMGAEVTISARKSSDLAWIKLNGFQGVVTGNFEGIGKYNIVYNTVPSMVFNKDILSQMNRDTLIIDLASKPGGVDFEVAENLGIKAIQALALPGKIAPKSAGEIIESTILTILKEDDG